MSSFFFLRYVKHLLALPEYEYLMSSFIFGGAVLQLYNSTINEDNSVTNGFHYLFQTIFTIDIILKIIKSFDESFKVFILNPWNVFDFLLTAFVWIPTIAPTMQSTKFLVFLRIARTLKILKNLSFVKDLGVILNAISGSFFAMIYLLFLLFLVLFYFSCAATLLFKFSAPYHFGDIKSSLKSLLQIMTLDNWSYLMYTCIYGCKYFGYDSGYDDFDSLCSFDPNDHSIYAEGAGLGLSLIHI